MTSSFCCCLTSVMCVFAGGRWTRGVRVEDGQQRGAQEARKSSRATHHHQGGLQGGWVCVATVPTKKMKENKSFTIEVCVCVCVCCERWCA